MQKTTEATGNLIGNKITDQVTKVSSTSSHNILNTVTNETENIGLNRKILKQRYVSPDIRQKIIYFTI